ncbi:MAG: nuclear transport factor 2 family protein [Desulfobacteraceae bacterium]|nr:nuclear transport factor 2 family protein [Desulfobacteraceae bacterium]
MKKTMTAAQADRFIKDYFFELFEKRNIEALDQYLHEDYWDDDIGETGVDHLENSKRYLSNLFQQFPSIRVDVLNSAVEHDVITAYLEWSYKMDSRKVIWKRGIGIFVLNSNTIIKRHTYIYYSNDE